MPPEWKPLKYPPARPWRYVAAALTSGVVFAGTWLVSGSWGIAALVTLVLIMAGLIDVFFLRAPAD